MPSDTIRCDVMPTKFAVPQINEMIVIVIVEMRREVLKRWREKKDRERLDTNGIQKSE